MTEQATSKDTTKRLKKDVAEYKKGTPVEVVKTYQETGHQRVRALVGKDEYGKEIKSADMIVGPDDVG